MIKNIQILLINDNDDKKMIYFNIEIVLANLNILFYFI